MPWYSKGFLVLWANFVSVNHPTQTHLQEIAAEAAEAAKGEMTLQSPSWPSCSLFVCASEQSAVHNASGICELKRATSSYRSAAQKLYQTLVGCRPPAKWRTNLRSNAKRRSGGLAPSKMLPWYLIPTKACMFCDNVSQQCSNMLMNFSGDYGGVFIATVNVDSIIRHF